VILIYTAVVLFFCTPSDRVTHTFVLGHYQLELSGVLDWALSTASSSRVSSWRVTYTSLPTPGDRRDSSFLDGVLVVHQKASRHLLLLDDKERIRDSRLLRGGGGGGVFFCVFERCCVGVAAHFVACVSVTDC
jgi:hypothetical protein